MFGTTKDRAGNPPGSNGSLDLPRIPGTAGALRIPEGRPASEPGTTEAIREVFDFAVQVRNGLAQHVVGQGDMLDATAMAVVSGASFCAVGPYGVGKSYTPKVLHKILGVMGRTIALHPEITHADINGFVSLDPQTGRRIVNPSPFLKHQVIALDELNRAGDKGQNSLLHVLNDKEVVIGNDSETARKVDPALTVIGTMNPSGEAGTRLVIPALADRFDFVVHLSPPAKGEIAAGLARYVDDLDAETGETLGDIRPLFGGYRPQRPDGAEFEPLFESDSAGKRKILETRKLFRSVLKQVDRRLLIEIDSLLYHFTVGSAVWDDSSQTLTSRTQRRGQALLLYATAKAIFDEQRMPNLGKDVWDVARHCLEMIPPKPEYWNKGSEWLIREINYRLTEIQPAVMKDVKRAGG